MGVGDVGRVGARPVAGRVQRARGGGGGLSVAVDYGDRQAGDGQCFSDGTSDPLAGPSNDGGGSASSAGGDLSAIQASSPLITHSAVRNRAQWALNPRSSMTKDKQTSLRQCLPNWSTASLDRKRTSCQPLEIRQSRPKTQTETTLCFYLNAKSYSSWLAVTAKRDADHAPYAAAIRDSPLPPPLTITEGD
ncbi:hypothetical protein GCM10022402_06610 [Salinactinospora qingdaonensis]|uniref:Uncharacterized protein n=1 Tax=Salinactinospora qingdaonensis TaxID=702744 RepID=A0ABP7EZW3_9ACTN